MPYTLNGATRIHYEVAGEGPALVLHHGLSDSLESWRDYGYVAALRHAFRLILIDARGHGRSDKPHDLAAYSLALRTADVLAVLDDLGIARAHYLGYSLGGWVGFGLAGAAPERIASLMLLGAHPFGQNMELFRRGFAHGLAGWAGLVAEQIGAALPAAVRQRLLANDIDALRASVADDRMSIAEVLPQIAAPCLLVCGGADPLLPLVRHAATKLAQAVVVELPDLNHLQTTTRSDLVLPYVTQFLTERQTQEVQI